MIEHLAAALRGAGVDPDWRDLADALWLADLRHAAAAAGPAPQRPTTEDPMTVRPSASAAGRTDTGPAAMEDHRGTEGRPRLEYSDAADGTPLRAATDPRRALPAQLGIGRAFRRLARTRPSRVATALDVEATVARYCDTGVLVPVTTPAREGWFHDVVLIVDASPTMAVWQPTVSALASVLAHHRAFRAVHRWTLTGDRSHVRVRSGAGLTFEPAEIADPQRRQLILLVTDCVDDLWRGSAVWQVLRDWGERMPVTLVQVLPRRLWPATAMGDADTSVSGVTRGTVNRRLAVHQPWWWDDPRPPRHVLPVTTLEPARLDQWARMLMSADRTPSAALLIGAESRQPEPGLPATAGQRVTFFRTTASDPAVRLATLLSAVEATLPVMHLIAGRLIPGATVAHLAEVLISGLLQTGEEDTTRYEFRPGVRAILREALTADDTLDVWRTVAPFLEEATGRRTPFMNRLSNQPSDPAVSGELTELADDLVTRLGLALPPPERPDPNRFHYSLSGPVDQIRELRNGLRSWFTTLDLDPAKATNLLLAASEATVNAIQHAYRDGPAGEVEITGNATATDIELTVRDYGSWKDYQPNPASRGLDLIGYATDEMDIVRSGTGTTVFMRLSRSVDPLDEEVPEDRQFHDAVASACEDLVDVEIGHDDRDFSAVRSWADGGATIDAVEPDLTTVNWWVTDRLDGTTELGHVEVDASIIFGGFAEKGSASALDVTVLDPDLDDHYAQVAFTTDRPWTLRWDYRRELDERPSLDFVGVVEPEIDPHSYLAPEEPRPVPIDPDHGFERALRAGDPMGERFRWAVRRAFDRLYDGPRTGHYTFDQLTRSERTMLPAMVRTELAGEFVFAEEGDNRFRWRGFEFAVAFTQRPYRWTLSWPADPRLQLLITADDTRATLQVGVVALTADAFNDLNGDRKGTLSGEGRETVRWVYRDIGLPPNVLATMAEADVDAVMSHGSSSRRLAELFRRAVQQPVSDVVVATVCRPQQETGRRVREARDRLRADGILVLSNSRLYEAHILRVLGLRLPDRWWMSIRVTPDPGDGRRPAFEADGRWWVVAGLDDPVVEAPLTT
jgi:anti-sigma regulatory factor (Ser/Thr protein kinase)